MKTSQRSIVASPSNDDITIEPTEKLPALHRTAPVLSDEAHAALLDNVTTDTTDTPSTDAAVDAINKQDGDDLLAADDTTTPPVVDAPDTWLQRLLLWLHGWSRGRKLLVSGLVLLSLIAVVSAIPNTRYYGLNAVGVRSSLRLTATDQTTGLPLKDVLVRLQGVGRQTDSNGLVVFSDVKLGRTLLEISKPAFATERSYITVGLGSNPLGKFDLQATGAQFKFTVLDYISNKAISAVQVSSGEADALSDSKGNVVLTADTGTSSIEAVFVKAGYRDEKITVSASSQTVPIRMVPDKPNVFVSRQSGRYDVCTIDIDGKNRRVVLAGSGREDANNTLSVSPDGVSALVVSKRDDNRDSDGFLLQALTIIDVASGASRTIDHAEQIQFIGWLGNRAIYQTTVAGASAANKNRSKLMSYDVVADARLQLANANYFSGAVTAQEYVYYATSSSDPAIKPALYRIKANAEDRQTISDTVVWTMLRSGYDELALQTPDGWYAYKMGGALPHASDQPGSLISRTYIDRADGAYTLRVDTRDGKGVLLRLDVSSGKETVVATMEDITNPVRWLTSRSAIFRVTTNDQTADYVVSFDGATQPQKITDVTPTL